MSKCTFQYFKSIFENLPEKEQEITREVLEEMDHSIGYDLKQIDIKNGILNAASGYSIADLIILLQLKQQGISGLHLQMSLTLAQIIRLLTVSKPKRQKAKNYDKEMQSYNLRKQYKAELSQNILMWKSSFTAMLNRNSRNSVYYSDLIEHFKLTEHEIRMASDFFNEKKQSLEWLFNTLNEDDQYAEYSCAVTPQIRQAGNRLSGLAGTAYASLLA